MGELIYNFLSFFSGGGLPLSLNNFYFMLDLYFPLEHEDAILISKLLI